MLFEVYSMSVLSCVQEQIDQDPIPYQLPDGSVVQASGHSAQCRNYFIVKAFYC